MPKRRRSDASPAEFKKTMVDLKNEVNRMLVEVRSVPSYDPRV